MAHPQVVFFHDDYFSFAEDRTKPTCGQLRLACVTSEAVSQTRGRNGAEMRTDADLSYTLTRSCRSSFVCFSSAKLNIELAYPHHVVVSCLEMSSSGIAKMRKGNIQRTNYLYMLLSFEITGRWRRLIGIRRGPGSIHMGLGKLLVRLNMQERCTRRRWDLVPQDLCTCSKTSCPTVICHEAALFGQLVSSLGEEVPDLDPIRPMRGVQKSLLQPCLSPLHRL